MVGDTDWPFINAGELMWVRIVPTGEERWSPQSDWNVIKSYLKRFDVVPATIRENGMQKRVLLRSDPDKGWIVDDPRGETAFEKAPVVIDDDKEVEKCLLSNNWFSIGCTFEPTQLEIEFRPNNEGYSLFAQKHFGQRMFEIKDTFWRYSRKGRELIVERDDGSFHNVHIELCREFKVAGSVTGGELSFYDVTLTLSQHILPLECGSVESFPKEYWGKPKSKPEVDAHG